MTDTALLRVLDAAGIATARLDAEGRVVTASPAFARVWGRSMDEVCGAHLVGLCPDHEQAEVLSAIVHMLEGVAEVERRDLRIDPGGDDARILQLTLGAAADERGHVDEVAVVVHDITTPHRAEQRRRRHIVEVTRFATSDAATGLPNRRGFDALLGSAARRSARTGYPFSLMRVDVTGLDVVLAGGDSADAGRLVEICAARLSERLRPSDDVCRIEDGTFMVIAEDLGDEQDAAGVAYRLLSSAIEPVEVDGRSVHLSLTVGVVVADGVATPEQMEATADRALASAHLDGPGGFRIIDVRAGRAA